LKAEWAVSIICLLIISFSFLGVASTHVAAAGGQFGNATNSSSVSTSTAFSDIPNNTVSAIIPTTILTTSSSNSTGGFQNATVGSQYVVGVAPQVIYGGFSPATFVLNFFQSGVINTSVDALNNGLYTYLVQNGNPLSSISFNLNSSDTYIIFIQITYPYAINSNLTWRLTDPGQFPSGGSEGFVKTNVIDLEFQISLLEYFSIPTAAQIANATVFAEHDYLDEQVVDLHNEELNFEQTTNMIVFWDNIGVIIAVIITVIAAIFMYRQANKIR
jgi:hypothetical protein